MTNVRPLGKECINRNAMDASQPPRPRNKQMRMLRFAPQSDGHFGDMSSFYTKPWDEWIMRLYLPCCKRISIVSCYSRSTLPPEHRTDETATK